MAKHLNWLQVDRFLRQGGLTLFSYYDVYFMLRKGMVTVDQRLRLAEVEQELLRSKLNLQRELALFLPRSHHAVLRDFSRGLEAELARHSA